MIVTVLYVAFRSKPPVVEAIGSVGHLNEFPNLVFPIITLLGGSCGGYITFSGAHRLLDAGFSGTKDLPHVRRSVLMGVSVSGVMRILLFLAVLGVVTATPEVVGSEAWVASPPAAALRQAQASSVTRSSVWLSCLQLSPPSSVQRIHPYPS